MIKEHIAAAEKEHVLKVASRSRTLKEAATTLGLSSQGLLRLFKKHGLTSAEAIGGGRSAMRKLKRGAE